MKQVGQEFRSSRPWGRPSQPTFRTEEWRRTDPDLFRFKKFERRPALPALDQVDEEDWDVHFDVVVAVTDTGYAITDQSVLETLEKNLVTSLEARKAA